MTCHHESERIPPGQQRHLGTLETHPSPAVVAWLNQAEFYLPVPVIAEIQEGAEALPSAARKAQLNAKLDEVMTDFAGAILEWDV